jgi:hypothetical protein
MLQGRGRGGGNAWFTQQCVDGREASQVRLSFSLQSSRTTTAIVLSYLLSDVVSWEEVCVAVDAV